MARPKTGREIDTFLRLSKEGRKALENLCKISKLSSLNAYADKLFVKLNEKGTPIVTAQRAEKSNN